MAERKLLLVTLFRVSGALCLVGAGLFAIAAVLSILGAANAGVFECAVGLFVCVFTGFFYYGLAQVITLIAEIAESTEAASTALHRYLPSVVQDLSKPASAPAFAAPRSAVPSRSDPKRYYYYAESAESGPYSLQDMIDFFEAGVIGAETPVRKTGEREWVAFDSHPEMKK